MEHGPIDPADAERAILDLLALRGPGKTICPSEAARALGGDDGFRPLMALVRDAAGALAAGGQIEITQRGRRVDVDEPRGPIRLRARLDRAATEVLAGVVVSYLSIADARRCVCAETSHECRNSCSAKDGPADGKWMSAWLIWDTA